MSDGSAISRAVHAEAEAAREEIRSAGIHCPSCGQNVADLTATGHGLEFSEGDLPATVAAGGTAQCPGGQPADLREHLTGRAADMYETVKALATVGVLGDYNRRFEQVAAEQIIGPPRTEPFEGFLSILKPSA